jgi:hypothetical protein
MHPELPPRCSRCARFWQNFFGLCVSRQPFKFVGDSSQHLRRIGTVDNQSADAPETRSKIGSWACFSAYREVRLE